MSRYYIYQSIYWLFQGYIILLFIRILSSWVPSWRHLQFFRFVAFYTDPYLNIFRRIIPPIGGVLDLSPVLAFIVLRFLETIVLGWLR